MSRVARSRGCVLPPPVALVYGLASGKVPRRARGHPPLRPARQIARSPDRQIAGSMQMSNTILPPLQRGRLRPSWRPSPAWPRTPATPTSCTPTSFAAGSPGARRIGSIHSPNSLRHAAITNAHDAGVPLRDAQILARHADPRTTEHNDRPRGNLDRHGVHFLTDLYATDKPRKRSSPSIATTSVTGGLRTATLVCGGPNGQLRTPGGPPTTSSRSASRMPTTVTGMRPPSRGRRGSGLFSRCRCRSGTNGQHRESQTDPRLFAAS